MSTKKLNGTLRVPGDKSITHRALMFAALTRGTSTISGMSPAQDCNSTADCLSRLGMQVERLTADEVRITSHGLDGLRQPEQILDAGNSGTTIRLLSGLLAGRTFRSTFTGDQSLQSRPMSRVLAPLVEMGVRIEYLAKENYAPFAISGGNLTGQEFNLKVASAQVQTALLLAGLQAEGTTTVHLPAAVRDHTLRMFEMIGIPFSSLNNQRTSVSVSRLEKPVSAYAAKVPADISSAAFFMVAAACLPGSDVTLTDVVINPGRDLIIDVLQEMGADVTVTAQGESCGEPVAIVRVKGGELKGTVIGGDRLARGIDEVPILAIAGALCNGVFEVKEGQELRVKESDRIKAIVNNLSAAGASISETDDGFRIEGRQTLAGGKEWLTHHDHRMAMSGMVASVVARQEVTVDHPDCVAVSYPNFQEDMAKLLVDA